MRQEKDNIKDGGAAYSERTLPRCLYGDMAVWNRENGTFRGILMYSLPEQNPQVLQQYLDPMRMRMAPPASSALDL